MDTYSGRKIKRRARKRSGPPKEIHTCDESVAGADPSTSYLDVIPEARALYRSNSFGPKRKLHDSICEEETKRAKESQKFQRPKFSLSGGGSSDSDNSSSSSGDEADDQDESSKFPEFVKALVRRPRRKRKVFSYTEVVDMIDDLMKDFRLTDETYERIMGLLEMEMESGLHIDTHHTSTVKMFPTYVHCTPNGTECGRFLALDLGGTNFRVLLIDLNGMDSPSMVSRLFLIPKRIMLGTGAMLFDHIARCISEFLDWQQLKAQHLKMGFTFSFPCHQDGLASARLVKWTKGFKCSDVEGHNVVQLLQEAIARRGDMNVECIAIISDPVGALMTGAHSDPRCQIGVILGTGTNCCYVESLERVQLMNGHRADPPQMLVNTEWGAFGDNGVLDFFRNAFDHELDRNSLNPGHQLFEKMISGMYMGEIVRLVLCQLTVDGLLFCGEGSEELFTSQRFLTKYISEIESDDPSGNWSSTKLVLQELDIGNFTVNDCRHVQHVCWQVSQRAAFLAATAVATIIKRLGRPEMTVAIDGSLYKFHPHFHDLMRKKISQLIPTECKFDLVLAHDGSGQGAALVAAVSQRYKAKNRRISTEGTKQQHINMGQSIQNNLVDSNGKSDLQNESITGFANENGMSMTPSTSTSSLDSTQKPMNISLSGANLEIYKAPTPMNISPRPSTSSLESMATI